MQIWRKWRFIQIKETEAATEKRFGLKKGQHVKRKDSWGAKAKKKGRKKKNKKRGAELKQKGRCWTETKRRRLKQKKRRKEIEKREGWNWKAEVLKLKDRGWTGRTETRYIFSIYFPSNILRKNDGEFVYVEFNV